MYQQDVLKLGWYTNIREKKNQIYLKNDCLKSTYFDISMPTRLTDLK